MKCIGINCGAGTFLVGAKRYFDPAVNYQSNGLGSDTCSIGNGIQVSRCTADHGSIPPHDTDCVFANGKDWTDCNLAFKYTIANNVPILFLDVQTALWTSHESFFNGLCKLAQKAGYRAVYLAYSTLSFDTGFNEGRTAFIFHDKRKNFNSIAPKLPKKLRNLYSYIWDDLDERVAEIPADSVEYGTNSCYEVPYDEKICLPRIQEGWTLRATARKRMFELPGSARLYLEDMLQNPNYRDLRKAGWGRKLLGTAGHEILHVHPHSRLLTIGEMMKVADWKRLPEGQYPIEQIMYGTPAVIGEWLAHQAKLWVEDFWEEKDFHIRYDRKERRFIGGEANPLRNKKFISITQYVNEFYDRSDEAAFPKRKKKSILNSEMNFLTY